MRIKTKDINQTDRNFKRVPQNGNTANGSITLDIVFSVILCIVVLCQLYKASGVASGYSDESGYWGTAAAFTGRDWSGLLSSNGYYSFIYALVLAPIMMLKVAPVVWYRIAIVVNAVFLVLSYFVGVSCLQSLFPYVKRNEIKVIAFTVSLYSTYLFYTQNTSGEILNLLLFWLALYSCIRFLEKNSYGSLLLFLSLTVLNFAAHMRNIAVLAAALITIIWVCLQKKEKVSKKIRMLILAAVCASVEVGIFQFVKRLIIRYVYANGAKTSINDVSGQTSKVRNLFSIQGIKSLITMSAGRVFYLNAASFFLVGIGFVFCLIVFIRNLSGKAGKVGESEKTGKGREKSAGSRLFNGQYFFVLLFLVLSLLASIGVSSVYFTSTGTHICYLYYGRYTENLIAPIMSIGLIVVIHDHELLKKWMPVAYVLLFILAVGLYQFMVRYGISDSAVHPNIAGIAGFFKPEGMNDQLFATFAVCVEAIFINMMILFVAGHTDKADRVMAKGINTGRGRNKDKVKDMQEGLQGKNKIIQYKDQQLQGDAVPEGHAAYRSAYCCCLFIAFCWVLSAFRYIETGIYSEDQLARQERYASLASDIIRTAGDNDVILPYESRVQTTAVRAATYLQFKIPDNRIILTDRTSLAEDENWPGKYSYVLYADDTIYPIQLTNCLNENFKMISKENDLTYYISYQTLDGMERSESESSCSSVHVNPGQMITTRKNNGANHGSRLVVGKNENMWGPYASLLPGAYTVTFTLKCLENNSGDVPLGVLRVESDTGENIMAETQITGDQFHGSEEIPISLSFETSRGEMLDNVEFKLYMTGDARLEVTDITYSRDDSYSEIFAEDSVDLNNIAHIMALDPDGLDVDVVMNSYERKNWGTDTLQDALGGHKVNVVDFCNQNAALLLPAEDFETLFSLLEQYTVLYRGSYYALLVPSDGNLVSRYTAEGGTALSHETLLDVRYFGQNIEDGFQATLPGGKYVVYFQMLNRNGDIYPANVTASIHSAPLISTSARENEAVQDGEMTEIDYNAAIGLSDDTLYTETFPVNFAADTQIDGTYSADNPCSDIHYAAYIGRSG